MIVSAKEQRVDEVTVGEPLVAVQLPARLITRLNSCVNLLWGPDPDHHGPLRDQLLAELVEDSVMLLETADYYEGAVAASENAELPANDTGYTCH